ncbi:bacteriocin immunity protein [Streptococcus hongkongensis]|nr:enterocin immunity protein [Streptococcus uberis]
MEKVRQNIYKQIKLAFDSPEIRENNQISLYLITASNDLIKNQNPMLVAKQLNYQVDHYLALNNMQLPQSLFALKKTLVKYSD